MAVNKTYLRQMRAYGRLSRWADSHPLLLNVLAAAEAAALILYVFMYY